MSKGERFVASMFGTILVVLLVLAINLAIVSIIALWRMVL